MLFVSLIPKSITISAGHFATGDSPTMLTNRSTTVADILREAGFATRLIGKWGLDGNFQTPRPPNVGFPTLQGFQSFYGQSDQWQCHDYYPQFQFNDTQNLTVPRNQVIRPIGAEGLDRRGPAGSCRLFLGPGFRLAARWNRLVETVNAQKTGENGEKMGEVWSNKIFPTWCYAAA